jgi:hypothetical protein
MSVTGTTIRTSNTAVDGINPGMSESARKSTRESTRYGR